MIRTRSEILIAIIGLILILVSLGYCAVMIRITRDGVREHREYIRERDVRWERCIADVERGQAEIITRLQRIEGK